MSTEQEAPEAQQSQVALPNRRSVLKLGASAALGIGAYALAACETSNSSPGTTASAQSGESVLDKWLSSKTAKLGVDLTFPPIQFKDASGNPTGYQMELTIAMMQDLGVTPQWVEIPFGQLFAGLVAGKFDMMGISATILPSRALKGLFSSFPVFYESIVVLLKPGSSVTDSSQLAGKKIAVLQGSSQEFSSHQLFPNASFSPFAQLADAVNEVATGRADAVVLSEFDVDSSKSAHPDLVVLQGPPLWVDANTYLMPLGDYKLQAWVNNWLRYNATHQRLVAGWKKWLGPGLQKYKLTTYGVGPGGAPELVQGGPPAGPAPRAPATRSAVERMIPLSYAFDWRVVTDRWHLFVQGAWVDVEIAVFGFVFACVIGLLNAILRTSGVRVFSIPSFVYVQVMRGIPLYVMLLWIYFGIANILGLNFTNVQAMVIALALTGSGYTTEIFRAGLGAVDRGQLEAARSIGLSRTRTYGHVILPQTFRIVVPPLGNTFVGLLKGATICSLIAVPDMVFLANELNVTLFTPFEVFTAVAVILVVLVFFFSAVVYVLERRLRLP